jgi:hypothetical protein
VAIFAALGLGVSERCAAREIRVETFPAHEADFFRHKNALVEGQARG